MSELKPEMEPLTARVTAPTILVCHKNSQQLFYTWKEALALYTSLGQALKAYKIAYPDKPER